MQELKKEKFNDTWIKFNKDGLYGTIIVSFDSSRGKQSFVAPNKYKGLEMAKEMILMLEANDTVLSSHAGVLSNKEKFIAYEKVRRGGLTNMFMINKVSNLSGLSVEDVKYVMKNYGDLSEKYNY